MTDDLLKVLEKNEALSKGFQVKIVFYKYSSQLPRASMLTQGQVEINIMYFQENFAYLIEQLMHKAHMLKPYINTLNGMKSDIYTIKQCRSRSAAFKFDLCESA